MEQDLTSRHNWLHYMLLQNVLNRVAFTTGEHMETLLIMPLARAYHNIKYDVIYLKRCHGSDHTQPMHQEGDVSL